ncbi:PIN domain-containing protein, partial [Methylobacterium oryzisoli]|uniref:PIN domain-containing protein n=1 Tax=Methylobacterium oryzisoli TaxID=3385502 RepID=UPI00389206D3
MLRVCLDLNVWVADLIGRQAGRTGTVLMRIVEMVKAMSVAGTPLQLVISQEMLGTLEAVLIRQKVPAFLAERFSAAVSNLMINGPEKLQPAVLTSGRDQLAMHDREDAGVLATCIAERVDLLVTDNLRDFITKDSERRDTRLVSRADGITRQLYTVLHERADGVALTIAHPIDAVDWLIPTLTDQNPRAQARRPMDMMRQG